MFPSILLKQNHGRSCGGGWNDSRDRFKISKEKSISTTVLVHGGPDGRAAGRDLSARIIGVCEPSK